MTNRQQSLFNFLLIMALLGIGLLFLCVVYMIPVCPNPCQSWWQQYLSSAGYGLVIGGAAYVSGALIGFLFGLPRYLSNPDTTKKNYSRNDNLIQISDWLTKIIVGLGLTNLYKVPDVVENFGRNAKVLFGGSDIGSAYAQAILIYFLVCGFLLGYLWTNIYYIPILMEMDKVADDLSGLQDKEVAANAVLDEHTDSINSSAPNAFTQFDNEQKKANPLAKLLSFAEFSTLIDKAKQKMAAGLQAQTSLPDNLKDPNKNQWGGKDEANGRKLTATISPVDGSKLFKVVVTLLSTNPEKTPLVDGNAILFSLHNSFIDPYRIVVIKAQIARLEFISYGAFTVGAICDDGVTELEYDLATIPGAPKQFTDN